MAVSNHLQSASGGFRGEPFFFEERGRRVKRERKESESKVKGERKKSEKR
jgi:hypothetical protein